MVVATESKRFTDVELAAEHWRAKMSEAIAERHRCMTEEWAEMVATVQRFATLPHYDDDAPDMHIYINEFDPIGGMVCSECGMPTESEPCEEHQPKAWAAME